MFKHAIAHALFFKGTQSRLNGLKSLVLFSGFLEFKGNSVDAQNNLKYRDRAPLSEKVQHVLF